MDPVDGGTGVGRGRSPRDGRHCRPSGWVADWSGVERNAVNRDWKAELANIEIHLRESAPVLAMRLDRFPAPLSNLPLWGVLIMAATAVVLWLFLPQP